MAIPDKLRAEALALPVSERAGLAAELLESLDEDAHEALDEEEIKKAWDEEIRRRVAEIESGEVEAISEEDFWKLLES